MSRGEERLEFDQILPLIAELAETLTTHDDSAVADTAMELLDWIDVFHANGVGRMVEMLREWRGDILLEAVAADPVAGSLLRAYGLGDEIDLDAARVAVQSALNEVRPYLHSHGGDMEVVHIADGHPATIVIIKVFDDVELVVLPQVVGKMEACLSRGERGEKLGGFIGLAGLEKDQR